MQLIQAKGLMPLGSASEFDKSWERTRRGWWRMRVMPARKRLRQEGHV